MATVVPEIAVRYAQGTELYDLESKTRKTTDIMERAKLLSKQRDSERHMRTHTCTHIPLLSLASWGRGDLSARQDLRVGDASRRIEAS